MMKIDRIKKEMLNYRDFYGGDIPDTDRIRNAITKEQLRNILESHRRHLEFMLSDANSHLDEFKRKIGLNI